MATERRLGFDLKGRAEEGALLGYGLFCYGCHDLSAGNLCSWQTAGKLQAYCRPTAPGELSRLMSPLWVDDWDKTSRLLLSAA